MSRPGEALARLSAGKPGAGPGPEPPAVRERGNPAVGAEEPARPGAAPAEDGDPLHQDMEAVQPSGAQSNHCWSG